MELFVEYFVVLINGLLFMTTKATRIDLIGLVLYVGVHFPEVHRIRDTIHDIA